jgi:hypothetical protein
MHARAIAGRSAKASPRVEHHVAGLAPGSREAAVEQVLQLQRTCGNQAVQRLLHRDAVRPIDVKEVTVSAQTMTRLGLAQAAIKQVNNEILKFGAGNQAEDIRKTRGVALQRTKVLQDKKDIDWQVTRDNAADEKRVQPEPARRNILLQYYGASVCDDFGYATFNYLRQIASGQKLTRAASPGLHHAFVIIGDLKTDTDNELVVADPWPTSPQAVVWSDFFGYHPERKALNIKNEMVADGSNIHEQMKSSITILQEKTKPEDLTADARVASTVAQLQNPQQLGADKVDELKDELIASIKFDNAVIDKFIAYVAANHTSFRSWKIRKFFGKLKGKTAAGRDIAALDASKRNKAIKLLLEFANTPQGLAVLADGYIEQLIVSQPQAFVWQHASTRKQGETKPIFYVQSGWTDAQKTLMLKQFEQDLKSNEHVSAKAAQELFPG